MGRTTQGLERKRMSNLVPIANMRALQKLYKSFKAAPIEKCAPPPTLPIAIQDLVDWMAHERGLSFNYQKTILHNLDTFADWIKEARGDKLLDAIRTEDLTDYLAAEKQRGLSSGSLKLVTIAIQMLFRFLKNRGDLKQDPAIMLESPRVSSRLPQVLKETEIDRLLAADLARSS
jgi:site-specific recombinase XerD